MQPHPFKRRPDMTNMLTRSQLDQVVGKAVTDFLLREPKQTHYHDSTAQGIIEEVLELLAAQPYF